MSFSNTPIGSRARRMRAAGAMPNSSSGRRSRPRTPGAGAGATPVPDVVAVNRLMYCLERNRREGGPAPGIDRVRYHDLGRQEASRAFERLRAAVLDRSYVAPPALPVDIPKKDGTYRRLMLDVITKRALAASVREAIFPVLVPRMSPLAFSVGGAGSGVPALLAELAAAFEFGNYEVLLNLDVRRAFPSVPLAGLMAVVRNTVADDHMVWLIEALVRGENNDTLGIPQGLGLSPLLLDLYMSDGFDAHWSNAPGVPFLARYVDNLPSLAGNVNEGREVVGRCRDLLRGLGLSLKDQPEEEYLIDLKAGTTTELLGFRVYLSDGKLKYDVAATALNALGDRLREAHDTDNPPVMAKAVIGGWFASVGPAFGNSRVEVITTDVLTIARRQGFKELPLEHLQRAWASAHQKWNDKFLQPARTRVEGGTRVV